MVTILKAAFVVLVTIPLSCLAIVVLLVDRSGRWYHRVARTWAKLILRVFGITVTVKGLERLDAARHYIYVSNHASMFDIPAVLATIPDEIRIVLKRELTKVPVWGWALSLGPYVTIDRGKARDAMKSLEEAAARIREGASVLLFAEGTRTRTGKLQPFKRGAFALAAKSGVPIVPVTINNTFGILPKGSLRIRPRDITMVLEEPVETASAKGKEGEMKLMKEVHEAIERHYVDQSTG